MMPISILVADDEPNLCTVIQQFLVNDGHAVVVVPNARDAMRALSERAFDLVITDILMPDGDGIDVITEVKRVQPKARVLAMSGGGRFVEAREFLQLARGIGAHAAIGKPFTWAQLHEAMERAMQ
jgi:DNA-binding NtrC family response regulator